MMNDIIVKDDIKIEDLIYEIRGKQVMLDSDLANIYKVETKRINEAVKNNIEKFPERYCFQLTIDEFNITLANIKEVELKKALEDTFDAENISALKEICISDGNMMKLANLSLDDVEKRKELSVKAEKEITELYDKLSIFNEELYGVVEQMIDIKTRQ